jgi:multiple sugar transport system substrate-binding protein
MSVTRNEIPIRPRRRAGATWRAAIAGVAVLGLLGVAAACSSDATDSGNGEDGGVVNITMSHGYTDVEADALTKQVDRWNSENPDIQVKLLFNGGNDSALEKTIAGFTAGNYPDIAYEFGSSLAQLAKQPKLVDLTEKVKAADVAWDDFYPGLRDASMVDGKVVGVPALVDNLALVYNKKMFADAGIAEPTADWTWEDFRDAAKKLTDSATQSYGWAYLNAADEDTVWRFLPLLWQAGGDLLNADNTAPEFDSGAGLDALTLLRDMAVTDKSVYLDTGDGNYLNLFNSSKIGMLWTGPWDLSSINEDVDYGVTTLPGTNGNNESVSGPDMYMLFDHSAARTEAAWKFITWLTSADAHLDFAIDTGDLPLRHSETELPKYDTFVKDYPANQVFVDNLDNVKHARPNIASYGEISAAIGHMIQSVLLGAAEPQAALDDATATVTSVLAGS